MAFLFGLFQLSYLIFWSITDGLLIIITGLLVKYHLTTHEATTHRIFQHWASKCQRVTERSFGKSIHVSCPDLSDPPALITANHQSWVDIFILLSFLQPHLPVMLFVMKKELKRIPIFGFAAQLMDLPLLSRDGNKQDIKKIRQCVRDFPHGIMVIFPEGTRFKPEKRGTEYTHLLPPKTTGIKLILQNAQHKRWLDCHIFYQKTFDFWSFLQGQTAHTHFKAEFIDYSGENDIIKQWTKKDQWMEKQYGSYKLSRAP